MRSAKIADISGLKQKIFQNNTSEGIRSGSRYTPDFLRWEMYRCTKYFPSSMYSIINGIEFYRQKDER